MRPITVGEVIPHYEKVISLQSVLAYRLWKAEPLLAIVTGWIAASIFASTFIGLAILIVRGLI